MSHKHNISNEYVMQAYNNIFITYAQIAYTYNMTKLEMDIAERIKQCMKTRKVTQQELADFLGIKQYSVSRMLSGYTFPTIDQLNLIAQWLDVSLYYLIGVQEESYRELSPEASKIAHAYETASPEVQAIIKRILEY